MTYVAWWCIFLGTLFGHSYDKLVVLCIVGVVCIFTTHNSHKVMTLFQKLRLILLRACVDFLWVCHAMFNFCGAAGSLSPIRGAYQLETCTVWPWSVFLLNDSKSEYYRFQSDEACIGLVLTWFGLSFSYEGLSRSHILIGSERVICH